MEPVTLRTARLELYLPMDSDIEAITAAAQDPEVPRWTTLPSPYERSHAEEFVRTAAAAWSDGAGFHWAIHDDSRWVGMIGLHGVARTASYGASAELGYWLAAPARGRGILTEAARAVLDFAFDPAGADLVRLDWKAVAGNVASARAARALGFRFEGTVRQALVDPRGRHDGWLASLLRGDDRAPHAWPVLEE